MIDWRITFENYPNSCWPDFPVAPDYSEWAAAQQTRARSANCLHADSVYVNLHYSDVWYYCDDS